MKSKNSRAIDQLEAAWLADVKSLSCVFCHAPPPSEAHHIKQGRHYLTVAACDPCHDGRVWNVGGMNEFDAANETVRGVNQLRAGRTPTPAISLRRTRQRSTATPSKIVPRPL